MYSEWVSQRHSVECDHNNKSVLNNFPPSVGREVSRSVLNNFVHEGIPDYRMLPTAKEVDWAMEVICYGMTLPMTEENDGEITKSCVNTYLEWLTILSTPKKGIPEALIKESDRYAQKMFQHFQNLFQPRNGGNLALQASLCVKVLQAIQTAVTAQKVNMSPETWEALLHFFLVINNILLSPPYSPGSLTEYLCNRLISVLLEVWLHACKYFFPTPSEWKTLQELCMCWRHHSSMIDYWSRTSLILTKKAIQYMYGSDFPMLTVASAKGDVKIPGDLDDNTLIQSWFRILHIIGNPVELCNRDIISDTRQFKEFALTSKDVISPATHPCLDSLPNIFLQAMKGIAVQADLFLCVSMTHEEPVKHTPIPAPIKSPSPTANKKRELKTLSIGTSLGLSDGSGLSSRAKTMPSRHSSGTMGTGIPEPVEHGHIQPAVVSHGSLFTKAFARPTSMPTVDSLLHLFGAWLFEAALAKVDMKASLEDLSKIFLSFCNIDVPVKQLSTPSTDRKSMGEEDFEPGRAEAYGSLCRIFCSQHSGQEIRPVYLSRFYLAVGIGLNYNKACTGHVLCSILLNSADLLRVDLQGVQVLLPHLITALEIVLPRMELHLNSRCKVSETELRRAAIHLLLSMLCLPLHYQNLQIQDITAGWKKKQRSGDVKEDQPQILTFLALRPRLIQLLLEALHCETDSFNVQILLAGMQLLVQDTATAESLGIADDTQLGEGDSGAWLGVCGRRRPRISTGSTSVSDSGSGSVETDAEGRLSFVQESFDEPCADPTTVCRLSVQLTHLLCNKLVVMRSSKWKPDVHITLAAFELLSGLAQLSSENLQKSECKSTIHWVCDYITHQANKPATHHSRDLHSTIVASFTCLQTWIMSHPWLMDMQDCLQAVMEVVELGISGSKSKNMTAKDPNQQIPEAPRLKGEKELKPVSFRVREAAEGLLTCIMEHLGAFPPPSGPAAMCSLLTEESLLMYAKSNKQEQKADRPFRYFVLRDHSIILGLWEDSLTGEVSLPTVTSVVRAPTGRHVWTMQLRHFSREKENLIAAHLSSPERPLPSKDRAVPSDGTRHRPFPEAVDSIPLTKADRSIPRMDDILDDKLSKVQDHMRTLMQKQSEYETVVQTKLDQQFANLQFPSPDTEVKPPSPVKDFQPTRLLLSHLGLLTLDSLKGNPTREFEDASIIALNTQTEGFQSAIKGLDSIPTRPQDTVFVFYVKSGQHESDAIIENEINSCKHKKPFIEFLLALGWPVDIDSHPGWTGNIEKAWKQPKEALRKPTLLSQAETVKYSSLSTITGSASTITGSDGVESGNEGELSARERLLKYRESFGSEEILSGRGSSRSSSPNLAAKRLGSPKIGRKFEQGDSIDARHIQGQTGKEANQILYYADVSCEVAFVVPSLLPRYQRFRSTPATGEESDEEVDLPTRVGLQRSGSMGSLAISSSSSSSFDSKAPLARQASEGVGSFSETRVVRMNADIAVDTRPLTKLSTHNISSETNIVVAWLEQFDDHTQFPVDDIMMEFDFSRDSGGFNVLGTSSVLEKETVVIFIHPLHSGLYRIHTRSTIRSPIAGPLVDGMVVSRRVLGTMVRQTAVNICRRRRLEIDTYSPPHVCRKLKIQDIVKKYRHELSVPQFYVSLFAQDN